MLRRAHRDTRGLSRALFVALIADDPDQSEEFFADFDTCLFTFGLQPRCLVARKSSLTVMLSMTC